MTTSVVRADRDEVIDFDFGGEEELLSATFRVPRRPDYPGEAVDGALGFLVRQLTSVGWLPGTGRPGAPWFASRPADG